MLFYVHITNNKNMSNSNFYTIDDLLETNWKPIYTKDSAVIMIIMAFIKKTSVYDLSVKYNLSRERIYQYLRAEGIYKKDGKFGFHQIDQALFNNHFNHDKLSVEAIASLLDIPVSLANNHAKTLMLPIVKKPKVKKVKKPKIIKNKINIEDININDFIKSYVIEKNSIYHTARVLNITHQQASKYATEHEIIQSKNRECSDSSNIDEKEFYNLFIEKNLTARQTALALNITMKQATKYILIKNLTKEQKGVVSNIDKDRLIDYFVTQDLSGSKTAELMEITESRAWKFIFKHGIKKKEKNRK